MYYRKMFRDLGANKVRYGIIFLVLAIGLMMVVGNVMASCNISDQMDRYFDDCKVESGEFVTLMKLSDDEVNELEDKGTQVQEQFYLDCDREDTTLRVFQNREAINKLKLISGHEAASDSELVVEKSYAEAHDLKLGDKLELHGTSYEICGIGTVPDYVSIKKNITDLNSDSKSFGLCFAADAAYDAIRDDLSGDEAEHLQYAYRITGDVIDDEIRDFVKNDTGTKLLSFVTKEDNGRITAYQADNETILSVSIMMGGMLAVLFAFILAVFAVHTINRDRVAIGTLYALGVGRAKVMQQYLLLPGLVLTAGGAAGLALGRILCGASIANSGASYSYPEIQHDFYPVSILYGLVLPVVLGVLINFLVLHGKLRKKPLDLIRGKKRSLRTPKLKLKKKKFISIYRIRQLMREKAIYILTFLGVFYVICIMMFAFTIYAAMNNYVENSTGHVKWNYMYVVNDLQDPQGNAETGVYEKAQASNVYSGKDTDVTILGIQEGSRYFDFDVDCEEDEILISDCAARKFAWKTGDKITLDNKEDGEKHSFTVKNIVPYDAGLFVFLPVNEMRTVYDLESDYDNVFFSEQEQESDDLGTILTTIRKSDIEESGHALMDSMMLTVIVMLCAAVIVFVAVLYLLLKQAMEKSSFGISIMQIFGYGQKEINRIFIHINTVLTAAAFLCAVFLGKPVIDQMYPNLVTDIDLGFDTGFSGGIYGLLALITAAAYGISMLLLKRRLNRMDYTEVLKNRE